MLSLGAAPLAAEAVSFLSRVRVQTRRFSSHELATEPDDLPASVSLEAGLQPFQVRKAMGLDAGGQYGGFSEATYADVSLANTGGRLSEMAERWGIDGRPVTIREGAVRVDPATGRRVMPRVRDMSIRCKALAETWSWSDTELRVRLTDTAALLAVPLQQSRCGGKGGFDGTEDLKGVTRPLAFGRVRNAKPLLLDPFLQLYQVHDGPIRELQVVRDNGVALETPQEASSLTDLLESELEAGAVSVLRELGVFRLGSIPAGIVTCDLLGDGELAAAVGSVSFDDGTTWDDGTKIEGAPAETRVFTQQLGGLVRRWAFWIGWDPRDIDRGWIAEINAAFPESCGVFLEAGGQRSALELISEAMISVCGWCEVDRTGTLTGGLMDRLRGRPTIRVTTEQVVAARRLDLPYTRPSWKYAAPYDRNWTPLSEDQVAAIVRDEDPSLAAWLTGPGRQAEAGDDRIRVAFPASQVGVPTPGFFATEAGARRAVARRLAVFGLDAMAIEVSVRSLGIRVRLGAVVAITLPRLGVPTERLFRVVGYDEAGARACTLTLFG